MPTQLQDPPSKGRPSENKDTSQPHISTSLQKHLTSDAVSNPSDSARQKTQMQPEQQTTALPFLNPAIRKQRELEDQLSKTIIENLALAKQNVQLQGQVLQLEGQLLIPKGEIANLKEQLFNLQDKNKHLERKAFDSAEGHKLEMSQFRAAVSKAFNESSVQQRQIDDQFASVLHAALQSRRERLQGCDHLVTAAMGDIQERKLGSSDAVPTSAESPQEMPQPRKSIFGGDSDSGANHSARHTSTIRLPTLQWIEDNQATGASPSLRLPDTTSKKRSSAVESSGEAVSKGRGKAKKPKTTDQKSPPAMSSLLGKDDVANPKALEQTGTKNAPTLDESRERPAVVVGAKTIPRKGFTGKTDASLQESGTGGKKAND